MYALVVVGAAMAIWVTVMLWMERQHEKKQSHIIDATDAASTIGTTHEGDHKLPDDKV